jgi:hypothetical protein
MINWSKEKLLEYIEHKELELIKYDDILRKLESGRLGSSFISIGVYGKRLQKVNIKINRVKQLLNIRNYYDKLV